MGGEGHDRFDASSSRLVYEERVQDRTDARLEESVSQGHRIGHADADFINRAGRGLSPKRRAELKKAKTLLSRRLEKARKSRSRAKASRQQKPPTG
jgi:hypothetical protein